MKRIFLTGATGVMGLKGMREILKFHDRLSNSADYEGEKSSFQLTVLARPGKRNEKKLRPFIEKGVKVIWGDLLDSSKINQGVENADIVLHVGGMVSPAADYEPEKTYKVNTESMSMIVEAALKRERKGERVEVVYIGSVAQYGSRTYPHQWGRVGDPIASATFDKYALSKNVAEMILSESGLKRWVSLRQTGILHPGLLGKADNPVAFHVPMADALEWVTDDDSGRLLAALCFKNLPESFWRNYYNVGGGESYRMSNYDFMKATLGAVGCPPPEKIFELNWFALRNFHGMFYQDSDLLDSYLHYRSGERCEDYLKRLKKNLAFYYRLAPLAPAFLIKTIMGRVADKAVLGTRRWIKEKNIPRIEAAYGSLDNYERIPDWNHFKVPMLWENGARLNHGFDENKLFHLLTVSDLERAAQFRGGKLISSDTKKLKHKKDKDSDVTLTDFESDNRCLRKGSGGLIETDEPLLWECSEGHRFYLTPRTVLKGGHWCPECLKAMERDPKELYRLARKSRFLHQII